MKKFALWSVLILFTLAACGSGNREVLVVVVTATPEPTLAATSTAAIEASATVDAANQVTTKQDLNMRAGDSTAYDVMTVIPGGESVQVIGINQAGTWYQVLYHEVVGWISVGFTNGEPPAGLPVASAPALPAGGGTNSGGDSGGGGGNGNDSYSFTLDISNDGESRTAEGELTPGDSDSVTVHFEGFSGSIDTGHLRVVLYCSAGEDEVELSESIPRSNHSNECNGDWDYQIEDSNSELVIGMTLPSGFSGNVDWTMTVEVNT